MTRQKILICLTRIPYPPVDGTRLRILENVIKGLIKEFKLEFLIITDENIRITQIEYLEKNFGKVFLFKFPKWQFYLNAFKGLFSNLPLQVNYFYFKKVQKWIDSNFNNYDGIYIHTIRLTKYFEKIENKKKILVDLNDAISLNYKDGKKFAPLLWRLIYFLEERRTLNYEVMILKTFKNFNVVSPYDKQYLFNQMSSYLEGIKFENISYGVKEEILNYKWKRKSKNLVFMGNLKYPPNYDAVIYFVKNIFPLIKKEIKEAKFLVIGKYNNLKLPRVEDVIFTGFLDNPYEVISQCAVFVNPIRFSAGVPTKVLEAMAIGIPIITTPNSVRGIYGVINEENIIIEELDPNKWFLRIKELLSNKNLSKKLSKNSRLLIINNYLSKVIQQKYVDFFKEILQ